MEEWRTLIYPLGFIATFLFTLRFFIQWAASEYKQKSVVNKPFWSVSLAGNVLMVLHTLIQIQFNVCLIQALNGVIAWRNLNLMQEKEKQVSFKTTILVMGSASITLLSVFWLQGQYFYGHVIWQRTPTYFFSDGGEHSLSFGWHLFGFFGIFLFASRFWVQWLAAERHQKSYLGRTFWWISLSGALMSVIYFMQMRDIVNAFGPGMGMIPYIRNLMLIRKQKKTTALSNAVEG